MERAKTWFSGVTDFFSMDSLIRTLFKPYRQISAATSATGSLDSRFQMFLDCSVSRLIGFVSRLVLLLVGCVIMVVGGFLCLVLFVLWPFLPFLPVAGIVLSLAGVTL